MQCDDERQGIGAAMTRRVRFIVSRACLRCWRSVAVAYRSGRNPARSVRLALCGRRRWTASAKRVIVMLTTHAQLPGLSAGHAWCAPRYSPPQLGRCWEEWRSLTSSSKSIRGVSFSARGKSQGRCAARGIARIGKPSRICSNTSAFVNSSFGAKSSTQFVQDRLATTDSAA